MKAMRFLFVRSHQARRLAQRATRDFAPPAHTWRLLAGRWYAGLPTQHANKQPQPWTRHANSAAALRPGPTTSARPGASPAKAAKPTWITIRNAYNALSCLWGLPFAIACGPCSGIHPSLRGLSGVVRAHCVDAKQKYYSVVYNRVAYCMPGTVTRGVSAPQQAPNREQRVTRLKRDPRASPSAAPVI